MKNQQLNDVRGLRRRPVGSGFTFLEVLVVVAILAGMAAIVVPMYVGRAEEARKDNCRIQIKEIEKALEMYRLDNARYPTTEQGLMALVQKPTTDPVPPKWKGYMADLPKDPWNNPFVYVAPGTRGPYDIISLGPDGQQSEDDIKSYDLQGTATPGVNGAPQQ
jgi:general secretion pathway protein G